MRKGLVEVELLTDEVITEIVPMMVRLCRKITEQAKAGLTYDDGAAEPTFEALAEAAVETLDALTAARLGASAPPELRTAGGVPAFLRCEHPNSGQGSGA